MTNWVASILTHPRVQICLVVIPDLHSRLSCAMEAYRIGATTEKSFSRVEWLFDVLVVEEIVDCVVCLLLVSLIAFPHDFDRVTFVSEGLGTF